MRNPFAKPEPSINAVKTLRENTPILILLNFLMPLRKVPIQTTAQILISYLMFFSIDTKLDNKSLMILTTI